MSENNIRLSVSKCKTFDSCKKKFEFTYILKLPRKEFTFHHLGKFCHEVLENFHNTYINGSTESFNIVMSQAWKTAWQNYKEKMTPEMKKECWDIFDQYLKQISKDKKNNIITSVLGCEKKFELKLTDHVVLTGCIDRIQSDPDGVLHLADYKTTKNKKYLKDDWFQLLSYAYVMLQDNPDIKKFRLSYILLRHNFEYITKEVFAADLLQVKDQYLNYAQQIETENTFEPNPTVLCNYCDFIDHCPEGKTKLFNRPTFGETTW